MNSDPCVNGGLAKPQLNFSLDAWLHVTVLCVTIITVSVSNRGAIPEETIILLIFIMNIMCFNYDFKSYQIHLVVQLDCLYHWNSCCISNCLNMFLHHQHSNHHGVDYVS